MNNISIRNIPPTKQHERMVQKAVKAHPHRAYFPKKKPTVHVEANKNMPEGIVLKAEWFASNASSLNSLSYSLPFLLEKFANDE